MIALTIYVGANDNPQDYDYGDIARVTRVRQYKNKISSKFKTHEEGEYVVFTGTGKCIPSSEICNPNVYILFISDGGEGLLPMADQRHGIDNALLKKPNKVLVSNTDWKLSEEIINLFPRERHMAMTMLELKGHITHKKTNEVFVFGENN